MLEPDVILERYLNEQFDRADNGGKTLFAELLTAQDLRFIAFIQRQSVCKTAFHFPHQLRHAVNIQFTYQLLKSSERYPEFLIVHH